jgi:hypothetical protein
VSRVRSIIKETIASRRRWCAFFSVHSFNPAKAVGRILRLSPSQAYLASHIAFATSRLARHGRLGPDRRTRQQGVGQLKASATERRRNTAIPQDTTHCDSDLWSVPIAKGCESSRLRSRHQQPTLGACDLFVVVPRTTRALSCVAACAGPRAAKRSTITSTPQASPRSRAAPTHLASQNRCSGGEILDHGDQEQGHARPSAGSVKTAILHSQTGGQR